jgi:signal transduction histidine kinase
VSWLRRIPAETRVVVLVVFLALFQAILLSIFGLEAIKGERRQVEERLSADAAIFLDRRVAGLLVHQLGHFANEAFDAAFIDGEPARLRTDPEAVRGLFVDAYLVTSEGEVSEPGNPPAPLIRPRELVDADMAAANAEAAAYRAAYRAADVDEADMPATAMALARSRPFALDESGSSLAIPFASAPLFLAANSNGGGPPKEALRAAHWIGVLNEAFGFAPKREAQSLITAVEQKLAGDPVLAAHRARVATLGALKRELTTFVPNRPPGIHENVWAGDAHRFYVRTKEDGSSRVLVVHTASLRALMNDVVAEAGREAQPGVTLRIEAEDAIPDEDVKRALPVVPGFAAAARITPEVVEAQASDRERFYRYIIAFSILGIISGGILTVRVVMREVKLAKLKSGFVSNVTHELKTPLTSIRLFADMLIAGQVTDEEEQRECLDVIAQETERLSSLIQKVLDFGRSESRRPRFRWVTDSLQPLIEREIVRFRRASGLDPASLSVEFAVNSPPVTYDPDAFREVISNLLTNAFKYSPRDNRQIRVTLGPQRGRVVLTVEDNGPGVAPRERRKIFEQFYRAGDLLTREVEGTGLGLSIARNIVRAHGGRITVEDREGGGARFVVKLPAASRRMAQPERTATEITG